MNHVSNDISNKNNRRINSELKSSKRLPSSAAMPSATHGGSHNTNSSSNSSSSGKDKHKIYSRISSKFVKCAWEQMDRGDIDVAPEVFSKLSDEVTNKLWELANNIKTYSRHNGGYVSSDLVNSVLKDSNCPPAIGCHDSAWDKFETDRPYYFQSDELVDLSEEYFKEVKDEANGKLVLTSVWISTHANCTHLSNFATKLCNAVFNGDPDSFQLAMEITENEPAISCILKFIIKEISKHLTTNFNSALLEKCLRFLNACIYNPYTRDSNIDMELITMAELLVSILLGPPWWHYDNNTNTEDLEFSIKLNDIKKSYEFDDDANSESSADTEDLFKTKSEFSTITQITQSNYGISNDIAMHIDQLNSEPLLQQNISNSGGIINEGNPNDLPDIEDPELANFKNECEELFAIMEEIRNSSQSIGSQPNTFDSFNIKKEKMDNEELGESFSFNNANILINPAAIDHDVNLQNMKRENHSIMNNENTITDYSSIKLENIEQLETQKNEHFRKVYTRMCKRKMIENVSNTIGYMAAKWGHFEKIVLLMVKGRLKIFYARLRESKLNENNCQWLMRCVYALWAVGEEGFIHLFNCIDRLDVDMLPLWFATHLNVGATYLRGSDYQYVYNWLYEVCGDALIPNMVYYTRYIKRFNQKHALTRHPGTYKISPKLQLKILPKPYKLLLNQYTNFFSNSKCHTMDKKRKINFKFPGCRPLPNTKNKRTAIKLERIETKLDRMVLFQSSIVIGKRKIMKPLSNEHKNNKYIHFSYYNL